MAKATAKAAKIAAPANREEAAELLARLGTLQNEIQAKLDRAQSLALKLAAVAAAATSARRAEADGIRKALKKWADKNRDEIVEPGTKTVKLTTGELAWRDTPESLALAEDVEESAVIAALRSAGFADCVRVVQELDKVAIKKTWPHLVESRRVTGLQLVAGETFQLKPLSIEQPIEMKTRTVNIADELDGKPRERKYA